LVHGDGAPAQGDWGVQVTRPGLASTLLQLCLDLPDRIIQAVEQEIEERCQTAGLHLGDNLERCLAPVKFSNDLRARSIPLLHLCGQGAHPALYDYGPCYQDLSAACGADHESVRAFSLDLWLPFA
jgi:hypothetical protein